MKITKEPKIHNTYTNINLYHNLLKEGKVLDVYEKEITKSINEDLSDIIVNASFEILDTDNGTYESCYLGSWMSLDPCGRYHHFISPNGITKKCEIFWKVLDEVASKLGCWIDNGEFDPTDIYLCKEYQEESIEEE